MTQRLAVILCKDRNPTAEQEALVANLAAGLEHRPGLDVTVMPHLYDLAPNGPAVRLLRSTGGPMIVLAWLYPRAASWVLDANGVRGRLGPTSSLPEEDAGEPAVPDRRADLPDRTIWCLHLRRHEQPEAYLAEIERIAESVLQSGPAVTGAAHGKVRIVEEATRPRWYPVVDFCRCTNCMECLNFCLFGVYSLGEEDAILVEQPDACRNGCPACSRICPEGAIMFPQHKDPAVAGDPKASRKGLKLDLSQLFGGAHPAQLAAAERNRALAEKDRENRPPAEPQPPPTEGGDDLDRLVEKLDELDL
jgi:NAD-dependent dihydropyrimidine dehydrogenase PreA subunit